MAEEKIDDFYQGIYDEIAGLLDFVNQVKNRHKKIEDLLSPYKKSDILIAKKLNGNAVKLLWYFRAMKGHGDVVEKLTYREISRDLSMGPQTIVNAMTELTEFNIVKVVKVRGGRSYYLTNSVDWKID